MAEKIDAVPPSLRVYRIPANILAESVAALRDLGQGIREAVILWQGKVLNDTTAEITKVHRPRQIAGELHFNVPFPERMRILSEIARDGGFILIQLHTHPRQAFHSQADDRMAITKHTGALSVVIPDFGMHWTGSLSETAIFIHQGAARWRKLAPAEVQSMFEILP
jgi:hypothetical protein